MGFMFITTNAIAMPGKNMKMVVYVKMFVCFRRLQGWRILDVKKRLAATTALPGRLKQPWLQPQQPQRMICNYVIETMRILDTLKNSCVQLELLQRPLETD